MTEYRTVKTTYEVWKAIKAAHLDKLRVYGSFTDLSDSPYGSNTVFTSYGFDLGDFPVMEARSTWENCDGKYNPEAQYFYFDRINECHKYYLCLPVKVEE